MTISDGADYDGAVRDIEEAADQVDGVRHDVMTYTTRAIRNVGALTRGENTVEGNDGLDAMTGSDRPLVVRVFGQVQEVLQQQAARVRDEIADVEGVIDSRLNLPEKQATVEIEVDLDNAQRFGVSPGIVRRAAATLLHGIQVGSVFQEQKVFDVVVQGAPNIRGERR